MSSAEHDPPNTTIASPGGEPEAPHILCQRCGAPLPIQPLHASVSCSYCRIDTVVPVQLQARAAEHHARVARAHERGADARAMDAGIQATRELGRLNPRHVLGMLGVAAAMVGGVLLKAGDQWALGGTLIVLGVLAAVLSFRGTLTSAGQATRQVAAKAAEAREQRPNVSGRSTCSNCGAPVAFQAGSLATGCPSCGATVLAPEPLGGELAQRAEWAGHREQMKAERRLRDTAREALRHSAHWRPAPDHVFGRVLAEHCARLGWQVTNGDARAALDWLDAHWLAAAPHGVMYSHEDRSRWNVVGQLDGFPILLVVAQVVPGRARAWPAFHLLLAAVVERPHQLASSAPEPARLRDLGCCWELGYGGLVVSHDRADERLLQPETFDLVLASARAVLHQSSGVAERHAVAALPG